MLTRVLLLPGLHDSDQDHWQSLWQAQHPDYTKLEQQDWRTPRREHWVETLEESVRRHGPEIVLVAHSLACSLVAFWNESSHLCVRGALLVSPADTQAANFPAGPTGFAPLPLTRLRFPSIVCASTDDPYVSLPRARWFAKAWGSRFVDAGALGHINSASGIGDWPGGQRLLEQLL